MIKSNRNIEWRPIEEKDLPLVKEMYDYFIDHTVATFHTEHLSVEELKEFIPINHPLHPADFIVLDGEICGYCYLAPFKKRQAYNRTAEVTLYIVPKFHRQGLGSLTLQHIEGEAKKRGLKVLMGVITGNNMESVRLFRALGYEKCAHFKEVGEKFGKVQDVVIYQKLI